MSPRREVIGGAELWLGDAFDVLPTLAPVDAILTDPPFGIRDDEWDAMDEAEFARFSMHWLALIRPLCREAAVFGLYESPIAGPLRALFKRVRPIIWHKPPGSQLSGVKEAKLWFAFEVIYHCHDRQPQTVVEPKSLRVGELIKAARVSAGISRSGVDIAIRGKKTGLCFRWEEGACLPTPEQAAGLGRLLPLNGEFHDALSVAGTTRDRIKGLANALASERAAEKSDVLTHRTITGGPHPCEKPVPLIEDLLLTVGADWQAVVDPFMGVGSVGVAAAKLGRRFIGIERDGTYFDIACRRIEAAAREPRLALTLPDPAPTQAGLFGAEAAA